MFDRAAKGKVIATGDHTSPGLTGMPDGRCILCDAPGRYPYCGPGCEVADNPEEE
jgi:hypothetical protein